MTQGRVIVTYARSLMSLVIAQSLSRRGVEVIGCDDVDLTVLSFSRHVSDTFTHPNIDDDEDAYFDALVENIEKFRPGDDRPYVLMPVFSNTGAIARRRHLFPSYITVAAPDWDSIEKVFPKENLAQTAERAGVAAPATLYTDDAAALRREAVKLSPPVMLKPVDGVGGRGIETFHDIEAAVAAHADFINENGTPPLIQEKVTGDDYCFTGLFKDGELLSHMAYRNLKSFPRDTGAGAIRETIDDSAFLEPVQKLMRATNWTGVAEIDFLWSGNAGDEPILIEVNPRFWAGLFHSVKSGVDFPWQLYELFTKGRIDRPGAAKVGETTKAPGLWIASAAQEIAESSIDLDRLAQAWRTPCDDTLIQRIRRLSDGLKDAVDIDDACFRLFEVFDIAKNSSDELSEYDDPLTGLGALFVLSALARHGRLPDEVKFS